MTGWMMGSEGWLLVAAWAAVMVVVVWLLVREPSRPYRHDEPEAILRSRFARGEIGEEEYRRAMSVLDGDPAPEHRRGTPVGDAGPGQRSGHS